VLTAAQLEQRRSGIGASEIAAAANLSPYESRWDLWHKKVNGDDFEGNDATLLGNCLEDGVAQFYAAKRPGVRLKASPTLAHPDHPWALATPDRLVFASKHARRPSRLLEVKTAALNWTGAWSSEEDGIPEHYICQAQWQMFVAGAALGTRFDRVDVAALVAGVPGFYTVHRSEELIAHLLAAGLAFMALLASGEMPPIDGTDACTAELSRRFPRREQEQREATEEERHKMFELIRAREQAKAGEEAAKLLSNELVASADGHRLTLPASWPAAESLYGQPQRCGGGNRVDVAKLRADYPEVAAACTVETASSITFRTYTKKEKKPA